MKTGKHAGLILSLVARLSPVWVAAENKNRQPPTTATEKQTTGSVAADAQKSLAGAVDQAKETAQKSVTEGQKQLTEASAALQAKAQGIIDDAKKLVGEKKYTEALSLLQQQLAALKLTPDQQKLVDSLKEQIQQALDLFDCKRRQQEPRWFEEEPEQVTRRLRAIECARATVLRTIRSSSITRAATLQSTVAARVNRLGFRVAARIDTGRPTLNSPPRPGRELSHGQRAPGQTRQAPGSNWRQRRSRELASRSGP